MLFMLYCEKRCLAALRGIPSDLIEAARIDGAGLRQGIWYIVLPLLRPAFTVVIGTSLMVSMGWRAG